METYGIIVLALVVLLVCSQAAILLNYAAGSYNAEIAVYTAIGSLILLIILFLAGRKNKIWADLFPSLFSK